jgi:hypothetical protein
VADEEERSNGLLRLVLLLIAHRAATGFGADELHIYDEREYGQSTDEDRRVRR